MRSSLGQLEDFKKSVIWQDILDEINVWLEQIRGYLENVDLSASHRQLDRWGGCAEAIRNMQMIPEVLIGLAHDDNLLRKEVELRMKGGSDAGRS